MSLTVERLKLCMPDAGDRASLFLQPLEDAMARFHIDTLLRKACFLAQIAHESGSLRYTRELWGPTAAQLAYEGRADLGNTQLGDGKRFLGRGLIQTTGRTNTLRVLAALGKSEAELAWLETPAGAAMSAGWFWHDKGLNDTADLGNFGTITKKVNGGYNGLDDRIKHYVRIRRVLGI